MHYFSFVFFEHEVPLRYLKEANGGRVLYFVLLEQRLQEQLNECNVLGALKGTVCSHLVLYSVILALRYKVY